VFHGVPLHCPTTLGDFFGPRPPLLRKTTGNHTPGATWPSRTSRLKAAVAKPTQSWLARNYLLGAGCAHLEKYEKVNGKDDIPYVSIYYILLYISHICIYIYIPYMKWKIKAMLQSPPTSYESV
jgi:hypothetical protein